MNGVSVAEIAADAEAFASQVTYYFGSKEALFVEAACRDMLYLAREAESASTAANAAEDYLEIMVGCVIGAPALSLFVEALALVRRRPDLQTHVRAAFDRLDRESTRAFAEYRIRTGGSPEDDLAPAHRFWVLALGLTARGAATGEPPEVLAAEMMTLMRMGATD